MPDQEIGSLHFFQKSKWTPVFTGTPAHLFDFAVKLKKQHKIPVFILSGDAHMVAMDDGTNSDYASGGGAPIKVFHAAALDRPGSYKGGPYSHGYSKEPGQFGIVEITDDGNSAVCIRWLAKDTNGNIVKNTVGEEIRLDFCLDIEK